MPAEKPTGAPTGTKRNLAYPWRWVKRLPSRLAARLLRLLFWVNRSARFRQAGFVLPTTVLLLLMVSLTVGAMSYRSFTRSSQAIAEREQQVVDNVAAPAIDRARAKLEYLFTQDSRFPGGVPSSDVLAAMMLNNGEAGIIVAPADPYTLPDETRLKINGDSIDDPAWSFQTDLNGDGTPETIAYSILMDDEAMPPGGTTSQKIDSPVTTDKALALVTRNGPINTAEAAAGCSTSQRTPEGGWQQVSSSQLEKNFQINTLVVNGGEANRALSASEFQQVRQVNRGNKWGAWFRYDLEAFPSPELNWNGALHTEGSVITSQGFKAHMISSPSSCVYSNTNSEISLGEKEANAATNQPNFQGQVVLGALTQTAGGSDIRREGNDGSGRPKFHIFTSSNQPPQTDSDTELFLVNDSIKTLNNARPSEIALDPIRLFTAGISAHNETTTWERAPGWDGTIYRDEDDPRIRNLPDAKQPYVDDAYRADDRYGPKPVYKPKVTLKEEGNKKLGEQITSNNELTKFPSVPGTASLKDFGLDGYWERRAVAGGLRLIVGQRLELGNMFGWGASDDPLYPPNEVSTHEQRQRRALRDNLAAVQAMAVYHYETNNGRYPLACVASTTHPGTFMTLRDSRTFQNFPSTSTLEVNFLQGRGTNGWEFEVPFQSTSVANRQSTFGSAVNSKSTPLGSALRNLAYFAGDPEGGAPSFTPVQDTEVHPYPYLSMWGDFSKLRRIFDEYIDAGSSYGELSLADQSTLHTAACTLGMLAYNLDSLKTASEDIISDQGQTIADYVIDNFTGDPKTQTSEQWKTFLESQMSPEEFSRLSLYYQTERDRNLGFIGAGAKITDYPLGTDSGAFAAGTYEVTCDPDIEFSEITGNAKKLALAMIFCSKQAGPKYPSLYYLFPKADHNQRGTDNTYPQPNSEEYIDKFYISNSVVTDGKNNSLKVDYKTFDISAIKLEPRPTNGWKLPKDTVTVSNWESNEADVLRPVFDPDPLTRQPMTISTPSGGFINLALLDKGIMDGREMLNSRVMDINLDLLFNNDNVSDRWIAAQTDVDKASGVVYAFREEAVREDSIIRPKSADWDKCDTLAEITTSNCRMDVTGPSTPQDPPLNPENLISPKPVDFYPDPDRRPYGWRLINGKDFNRPDEVLNGIAFISDNPVYIKGDFNWHQNDSGALLEEFTEKLDDNYNNFYTRTTIDTTFATVEEDHWRPAEIFADAITILSDNFKDGVVEDAFVYGRGTDDDIDRGNPEVPSSYLNFNRFYSNSERSIAFGRDQWVRESDTASGNPDNPADEATPIKLGRNGDPELDPKAVTDPGATIYYGRFDQSTEHKANQVTAKPNTRINALLIAGIVPSRAKQSYGGIHNFPRLLEYWKDQNFYISGGFFQLNFSTQATGPYDQDAWEPNEDPKDETYNYFYNSAPRLWGYDVGLQYAPAAPIAQRFVTVGRPRSEYFRELPIDDPYIQNLCSAVSNCPR